MNAHLPTSTATNAYDLLSDICALVLEEPKRLNMSFFLIKNDPIQAHQLGHKAVPSCGTVGCVAGWTSVLRGQRVGAFGGGVGPEAAHILGLKEAQVEELFSNTLDEENAGTRAYARHEVRLIRAFQKRYAKQLKSKSV